MHTINRDSGLAPCVFCSKIIQLNSALLHLRSVKCKEIQSCVDNFDELLIQHKRKVNEVDDGAEDAYDYSDDEVKDEPVVEVTKKTKAKVSKKTV